MTQVFTDEQKKINAEVGFALHHALKMAAQLPKTDQSSRAVRMITTAANEADQVGRATVFEFHITQQADGSWALQYDFEYGEPRCTAGDLTPAGLLDDITRLVMGACPEVGEPVADSKDDPEDAGITVCDGPGNDEWRRSRAMEMAITANLGRHIDTVVAAAKTIEIFLKGGAQ